MTDLLERDPLLRCPAGSRDAGRLASPFGVVVVTNISRRQFDGTDLRDVISSSRVLCRDEASEGLGGDAFRKTSTATRRRSQGWSIR